MALQVTFSGTSSPSNTINQQGSGSTYTGYSPDFTVVIAALNNGTYKLTVLNYGGVSGWKNSFTMTKSDNNLADVIGSYSEDGGTGTADIQP